MQQTVFSYIIRKQFSTEYENVATEALAYILHSSESAQNGMMKLLRAVAPDIPDLGGVNSGLPSSYDHP